MRWAAGLATTGGRREARKKPKFIIRGDPGDRRHGIHAGPRGKDTRGVRRQKTGVRGTFRSWPLLGSPLKRQDRAGQNSLGLASLRFFRQALGFKGGP